MAAKQKTAAKKAPSQRPRAAAASKATARKKSAPLSPMTPSIGRWVHFHAPVPKSDNDTQIQAALITMVHGDECVNLKIMPDEGMDYRRSSVVYDDEGAANTWSWPERV